jgi:hypothetical protein
MAPTAATSSSPTLTRKGAQVALQAAEQYALEMGLPMFVSTILSWYTILYRDRSIAVVDAHTHLFSFTRMDGANIFTIDTAMEMAYTAASTGMPTSTCTVLYIPSTTTLID